MRLKGGPWAIFVSEPVTIRYRDGRGKMKETVKQPSWRYVYDVDEGHGKKPKGVPSIRLGALYRTKNGSVVQAGKPCYMGDYTGPQEVQFSFHYDSIGDRDQSGLVIHYDNELKHKSGNHIPQCEGYDIVGRFHELEDAEEKLAAAEDNRDNVLSDPKFPIVEWQKDE